MASWKAWLLEYLRQLVEAVVIQAGKRVRRGRDADRLIWLNWAARLCGILGGGIVVVMCGAVTA